MKILLALVPVLPLLAAPAILFAGRRAAGWMAVAVCAASLVLLGLLAGQNASMQAAWMVPGGFEVTVGLRLDAIAFAGALLVTAISLPVLVYSVAYAADEEGIPRFFAGMSFFVGAMLTLVLADSLLLLYAAWEWVGFASWLLIGFRFREQEARRAARRAFLVTRTGDAGFLLAWLLVLGVLGTTDLGELLAAAESGLSPALATLLPLLFFAAAVGKSAQLPLTAWLPPAMAGPTPVSALIHSATMVAAGVFLVLRLWPLFAASPMALQVILWTGGGTALLAALAATVQYDLKRVLAWSTVSQLGEMMLALGLGAPLAAAWHLGTHAAFKSTLFLAAGAVEHGGGGRDLRKMGGLARKMPWVAGGFGMAALALAGVPPFSGFWSEDAILAAALGTWPAAFLLLVLIFLAGSYIARAGFAAFGSWPGAPQPEAEKPAAAMKWSLLAMAAAAAVAGYLLKTPLEHALPFSPKGHAGVGWKTGAALAGVAGLALGAWRVRRAGPAPVFGAWPEFLASAAEAILLWPSRGAMEVSRAVEHFEQALDAAARGAAGFVLGAARVGAVSEAGFDLAGRVLARGAFALAGGTETTEDRGFGHGLDGFARSLGRAGGELRRLQSGKIYLYNLGIFAWVILLVFLGLMLLI